jgi:Rrf2 family protein
MTLSGGPDKCPWPAQLLHLPFLLLVLALLRLTSRRGRLGKNSAAMRVSAKADYALRAVIELAAAGDGPVKGERIAQAQEIPLKFLENILGDLRHAGLVRSQRGAEGGYWLARDADAITVADVVRAVEGPIANVRGLGPEAVEYVGAAEPLRDVWIAMRANLRAVLENVTVGEIARGELPSSITGIARDPDAWQPH